MKKTFRFSIVAGSFACLALFAALPAVAQLDRLYVKADLGGNLTQDTDLKDFFGPVTPGSKVKFDPGLRFGLAVGYQLTDWFAPEFEFGLMQNSIRSITEATRVDAWFSSVPFMLNAKFRCPGHCRFAPYIGGGVGGSTSVLTVDRIDRNEFTDVNGDDSDTVFAYQGFAGFRYRLNEQMGLSLEYRYFASDGPRWEGIAFGHIRTHALSVAFDYSF